MAAANPQKPWKTAQVLVHGGGPEINGWLQKLNIEPNFLNGLRVTDAPTMEIVEMVLVGKVNKSLVSLISVAGGTAVGMSGKDGNLLRASAARTDPSDGARRTPAALASLSAWSEPPPRVWLRAAGADDGPGAGLRGRSHVRGCAHCEGASVPGGARSQRPRRRLGGSGGSGAGPFRPNPTLQTGR